MPLTKTQRIAKDRLDRYRLAMEKEEIWGIELRDQLPEAWQTLEHDLDCVEKKVKVTLYLDESVAKMFRAMGRGWQGRINRLLGTWVQMKILGAWDLEERYYREFKRGLFASEQEMKERVRRKDEGRGSTCP